MRVAIPKVGNKISNHFGQSEGYVIYEIDMLEKKVDTKYLTTGSLKGCRSTGFLRKFEVELLIASYISENAMRKLEEQKINVITGVKGYLDTIINKFLNHSLIINKTPCQCDEFHEKCKCCGHRSDERNCFSKSKLQ